MRVRQWAFHSPGVAAQEGHQVKNVSPANHFSPDARKALKLLVLKH
jgi:hypothetical protein